MARFYLYKLASCGLTIYTAHPYTTLSKSTPDAVHVKAKINRNNHALWESISKILHLIRN